MQRALAKARERRDKKTDAKKTKSASAELSTKKKESYAIAELNALDGIGNLCPEGWLWQPRGFYDNAVPNGAPFAEDEIVSFDEFKSRIPIAAKANAAMQRAVEMSASMVQDLSGWNAIELNRDTDNCFRVVELGIADGSEVVVVASPVLKIIQGEPVLMFVAPKENLSQDPTKDNTTFRFRILKGHTIENLLLHRNYVVWANLAIVLFGLVTGWIGIQQLLGVEVKNSPIRKFRRILDI